MENRLSVFAVNAVGKDAEDRCGPFGGLWAYDPDGDPFVEQRVYDETPFLFEISQDTVGS